MLEANSWKSFENNEVSHSHSHYLFSIAEISRLNEAPRAADVARFLNVSRNAVSLQIKSLTLQKYIILDENKKIHLTKSGSKLTQKISDKKKIIKNFLLHIGVSEKNSETDSCKIEHLVSDESAKKIDKFIFPNNGGAK